MRGRRYRFAMGNVCEHRARPEIKDERQSDGQHRDNQHSLLKADGTKSFGDAGGACQDGGAVGEKVAEASGEQRAERSAAHVHGHEVDRHSGAALIRGDQILNGGINQTVITAEQGVGHREGNNSEKQRASRLEHAETGERCGGEGGHGGDAQPSIFSAADDGITQIAGGEAAGETSREIDDAAGDARRRE